ncbi:hypothetical protein [Liquorilactobacillus mali]|uniref:Uncharacterized protein n=1 Tax=Liquorilactobacillus mali KCTC 3596 = DSM 20444 TaxID=1046596 RepID=A0A0R2E6T0_9LACO|nr:hypothetical protein [Liquorilactobacillus mali]KRN09397.1 hypothetical protein FD00_GL001120 [Liquorilactobacillus mali KCTC 3596 = DSM 20444]
MDSSERSTVMNEYAKILWNSKNGTRKECGVNGKLYQYIIAITIDILLVFILLILFVSFVGWLIIACINIDNIIDANRNMWFKRGIYLTKFDGIYAQLIKFKHDHYDLSFVTENKYFIPLNLPESQLIRIARIKNNYYDLINDLSLTKTQLEDLENWLKNNEIQDDVQLLNTIHVDEVTNSTFFENGLSFTIKDINDDFFETEYGRKLKEKYNVSVFLGWGFREDKKTTLERLRCGEIINYGRRTLRTRLNWSGNNA